MRKKCLRAGILLALVSTSALAADPEPQTAPIPGWVKPATIPEANPARKDAASQVLLINSQTRFDKDGQATYFEYVIQPQSVAGLQSTGTIAIPWNVGRTDLTINAIEIRRAGKAIDLLKGADLTVIRRENNLEKAMLDGVRTVILPAKGLQIGDQVRVAATYGIKTDAVGGHGEDIQDWHLGFDVVSLQRRFLVTPGADVKWRAASRVVKPATSATPQGTEYLFTAANVESVKYPTGIRGRDSTSDIQFTSFRTWSDVAKLGQPLYAKARQIEPGSPLAAEADRIAASTSDPKKRMMAALRLAQERVRYVALLLGDGAYVPVNASETWDRKFGDCKGKTTLLLALLDRLGVKADALYVSAQNSDILVDRLPSLITFDHVIARATIDGKHFYLDATDYGQRTLAEVSGTYLRHGLPLVEGAGLEALPRIPVEEPLRLSELVWDGSKGVAGELPFTAKLTLRGVMAAEARGKKAAADKASEFEDYLKDLMPGVGNKDLEIVSHTDDEATGEFIVAFKGKAGVYWDQIENLKGYRFSFSNDAAKWSEKFERDEGPFKDVPVRLNPNYWQREVETLIVPADGKAFKIDAPALDRTLAATHIWRNVSSEGNRITAVTNFQRIGDEMTAEEARKAETELKEIADSWAYIVAPRGFKPPKTED